MKILVDASLPHLEHWFPKPCSITYYVTPKELPALLEDNAVLLCRSTLAVTAELLSGTMIECVATASSGTDHIDTNFLKENEITLFDAKGANALAVADYVTACLAVLYPMGSPFPQQAGIVGLGAVGTQVAHRLNAAGIPVVCFDPLKEKYTPSFQSCAFNEIINSDLICIHANWHVDQPYPSYNLFNHKVLNQLKPGTTIINAARGGIVNEKDILKIYQKVQYCTDVYEKEPKVTTEIIERAFLCTPHIAGHSIEAKETAMQMLSNAIHCHYGLTPPLKYNNSFLEINNFQEYSSWQEVILSIYDPRHETNLLKLANNKTQAFSNIRKAHQHRHNFIRYDKPDFAPQIRQLLGVYF